MKIMTTSATGQSIKLIPRRFGSVSNIVVRDESTNKSFTYTNINTSTAFNNYISITNQGAGYVDSDSNTIFKEGRFYTLSVNDSSGIIYKDKIFITNQTVNQANNNYYDINSGEYTTDSQTAMNDNDYIII